jgi:hypothetical protein
LGVLTAWIALTGYKRREGWTWHALLWAIGIGSALSILRIPLLNVTLGAGTAATALAMLVVALGLGYKAFK